MDTADQLIALESELLGTGTRQNAARVAALLTDSFREFGSSGRVYRKHEIISALQQESAMQKTALNVEVSVLSDHVALLTYEAQAHQPGAPPSRSLRSSVWVRTAGEWRMLFHQGTRIP